MMVNIRGCAEDALTVLEDRLESQEAEDIVRVVDDATYRWQKGERPPADEIEDAEQARLLFGCAWGEQVVKALGWEWVKLFWEENTFYLAVVPPDRSLVIYPTDFMLACLQNPGIDVTVMLSYNMLLAGRLPKQSPGSYTDVMQGVHRIVPRG
jgi:hypothetical protein